MKECYVRLVTYVILYEPSSLCQVELVPSSHISFCHLEHMENIGNCITEYKQSESSKLGFSCNSDTTPI